MRDFARTLKSKVGLFTYALLVALQLSDSSYFSNRARIYLNLSIKINKR
jgi:hypothetical protein